MFFVKQRTAYEMHISDWSSDVCSSDLSDSRGPTIDCYVFDPSTGALSGRRRFATLDEATGRPDGGACDGESHYWSAGVSADRKSVVSGKSVSVRVDLGGRRLIKKKSNTHQHYYRQAEAYICTSVISGY